jgi:hypothetical protein
MKTIDAWKRTEPLAVRPKSLARTIKEYRLYFIDHAFDDAPQMTTTSYECAAAKDIPSPARCDPNKTPEVCEHFVSAAKKEVEDHISIFVQTLYGLSELVQDPAANVLNIYGKKMNTEDAIRAVYGQIERFRALHRLIADCSIPAAGYPQESEKDLVVP